jgi:hypothetical protein
MQYVNKIKFKYPEHYRQSKLKADEQCRHLKGIKTARFFDHQNDEVYYEPACKICGKILDSNEINLINNTLKKYVNL